MCVCVCVCVCVCKHAYWLLYDSLTISFLFFLLCVSVSVSLLSIFNVIKCQLYIQVGLDSKIYPLQARTPVIAACSYILGVRARSAETLLYLLGFLLLLLLLLLFRRKTNRAAQTVRARDLKLGQIVELNLGRTYQSLSPIGP